MALSIQSHVASRVKTVLCLLFFFASPPMNYAEELPEIEAQAFPIKILKKSKSERVLLIEHPASQVIDINQLLMFRNGSENLVAVKILKLYPEHYLFAVKRVREYPTKSRRFHHFEIGIQLRAYRKLRDLDQLKAQRIQLRKSER